MPHKVATAASSKDLLSQSAWERACIDAAAWINRRSNAYAFVGLVVAGILGGIVLTSSPLVGASVGVAAWVATNVLIYGAHIALAVKRQRDEARDYARTLGRHAHDYAEWARRREIAEDFRRETLEFARNVFDGGWPDSASA
jgi:hypothetical protein